MKRECSDAFRPSIRVFESSAQASEECARMLAVRVANKPNTVLGLPTGSTPEALYAELVRLHREGGVDWSRVTSFNLDEYWPMERNDPHSFARFMRERLFEPAGFEAARTHVPSGTVTLGEISEYCAGFERMISQAGGIDVQILGVGVNAHLGFNEPGAAVTSRTRRVELSAHTRARAAAAFAPDAVPRHGVTMGLGNILQAREVWVLAFGADKSSAVAQAIEGARVASCPASALQGHPNAHWFLDESAAERLSRSR